MGLVLPVRGSLPYQAGVDHYREQGPCLSRRQERQHHWLLTLSPAAVDTVLDCHSGQTATLTVWSYTNVVVTDETSGASLAISGNFPGGTKVAR